LGRHYKGLWRITAAIVVFGVLSFILVAIAIVINVRCPDKKRPEFLFWLLGYLFFFIALMCEGASIEYSKYGNTPVISVLNLRSNDIDFSNYYETYVGHSSESPAPGFKAWSRKAPTELLLEFPSFVDEAEREAVAEIYSHTDIAAYMQQFYDGLEGKDPYLDVCVSCAINWSEAQENGAIRGTNPCNWDLSRVSTARRMCIGDWTPELLQEYWCERYEEAKADLDCEKAHSDVDDWTCTKKRAVRERALVTQYSLGALHQNNRLLLGVQIVAFVVSCVAVFLDMLFRDPKLGPYGVPPEDKKAKTKPKEKKSKPTAESPAATPSETPPPSTEGAKPADVKPKAAPPLPPAPPAAKKESDSSSYYSDSESSPGERPPEPPKPVAGAKPRGSSSSLSSSSPAARPIARPPPPIPKKPSSESSTSSSSSSSVAPPPPPAPAPPVPATRGSSSDYYSSSSEQKTPPRPVLPPPPAPVVPRKASSSSDSSSTADHKPVASPPPRKSSSSEYSDSQSSGGPPPAPIAVSGEQASSTSSASESSSSSEKPAARPPPPPKAEEPSSDSYSGSQSGSGSSSSASRSSTS
jgi:hypothetical protein